MKQLLLSIFLFLISFIISAQEDYSRFQKQIDKQANDMEDILMTKDYISDFEKFNTIRFKRYIDIEANLIFNQIPNKSTDEVCFFVVL